MELRSASTSFCDLTEEKREAREVAERTTTQRGGLLEAVELTSDCLRRASICASASTSVLGGRRDAVDRL